jgi:4'-phosphopantetheinyl transferase EntD
LTAAPTVLDESRVRSAERLLSLFAGEVVGFEARAPIPTELLYPEEADFVRNAVEKRRLEFAAGRLCARHALAELDVRDFPLRVGEKRFPRWPEGIVGSITHTRGYCAAVAARRSHYEGIGIDVEGRGRLERKLEAHICTAAERRWLDGLPPSERQDMATVIFSAKEAFYKSQYCLTRSWLGFRDASIEVVGDRFEIALHKPLPLFSERDAPLLGRFANGD